MKIAIYGDSYAEILKNQYGKHAWAFRLINQYPGSQRFSLSGTSLFWSYELLTRTYQEFDKIIFVATNPYRVSICENTESTSWFLDRRLADKNLDPWLRKKFLSLLDYYVYVSTDPIVYRKDALFYELLIEKLLKLPVPVLVIPAFELTYNNGSNKLGLYSVTEMEESHWGKKWDNYASSKQSDNTALFSTETRLDHRQSHMTNPNNAILFDKIMSVLPTMTHGTELAIDPNEFVPPDAFENYVYVSDPNKQDDGY